MQTERRVGRKTDTCGYNQRSKRTKQTQTGDKGQGTKNEGRGTEDCKGKWEKRQKLCAIYVAK